MFRSRFTDAEWETVLFAPLWAFSAVAGADGKSNDRETAVLVKALSDAALFRDEFAREVLLALASDYATIMPAYGADRRTVVDGLREAAQILDANMPGGGADGLKNAILLVCMDVVKAAGPMFGDKLSKERQAAIHLVDSMLRVPVPATTDEVAEAPLGSSARPLCIGDLAERRHEARPLPARGTSPATADEVDCSVFAPPACRPGDTAFVQVFAHLPDEAELAASLAAEFDEDAVRRAIRSLLARVSRGDTLVFDLSFRDVPVPDPIQTLVWRGRPDSVQFEVPIRPDKPLGTVVGTVGVSLGPIPVGHVKFKLEISNAEREEARAVGDDARRYGRAFISYASPDRGKVVPRLQMLAPLGIRYFQDVLDLEPGQRFERELYRQIDDCDLFLLFWSSAAKRSEWVRREVDHALRRKAGDDFAPPEIRPIIIEGPPVEPPWEELAHIHFNDRLVWLLGAETARTEVRQ